MKKTLLFSLFVAFASIVKAQDTRAITPPSIDLTPQREAFRYLDVTLTAGSAGIGLDLGTSITKWMGVRTGFTYMPHFKPKMSFEVQVGDAKDSHERFSKLQERLQQLTGISVDETVHMYGEPKFNQFKFLMDFFPIPDNKHWHITAGFYLGPKRIAKSYNITEDMASLVGVNIYNQMYEKAVNDEPVLNFNGNDIYLPQFKKYGLMGFHVGDYTHDIYYTEDVIATEDFTPFIDKDGNEQYAMEGEVIHAAGDVKHHAGDPYIMTPDADCMVKAEMKVNVFRPYLGVGYDGRLLRNDDRYHIGFDAGVLFWGGTPQVITHDGTDLTHDVTNVRGSVGDYVKAIKAFKVFPILNLRLTRRF
ncbi:MAG: hypothetical protein J6W75_11580 [Bacteroidaceae bacterium]|nr:hypothetical protein [Bacteroidaceae bacterium]